MNRKQKRQRVKEFNSERKSISKEQNTEQQKIRANELPTISKTQAEAIRANMRKHIITVKYQDNTSRWNKKNEIKENDVLNNGGEMVSTLQ